MTKKKNNSGNNAIIVTKSLFLGGNVSPKDTYLEFFVQAGRMLGSTGTGYQNQYGAKNTIIPKAVVGKHVQYQCWFELG
ncbi:MAG TPA: hypothetical protein QF720_02250 [Nitrospinota bacterium]|nr:hypothetical protein [Nitrospinota bacterium]